MLKKVLIIDDDQLVCVSLKKALTRLNFNVEICLDAAEVFESIQNFDPDIILLDIYLTTHNGLEILKEIKIKYTDLPVIMITGYADVDIAVNAIKNGAYDFLLKPLDLDQLNTVLKKASENLNLKREVETLQEILRQDELTPDYFGKSGKIQRIVKTAQKLAKSSDTTVLIEGESGTGKEVFAKFIHQNSPRKTANFIQINCATIPKDLAESELFGHEKGAFTGAAQKTKLGKFELADKGTILLDEIGELTQDLQVKLLRVLQEKKFYRVGGEKEVEVDVRVLAATNKQLEDEVRAGNFREDLFYRLNVAKIVIPPLRERSEDIPSLSYSFLAEFNKKFQKNVTDIDPVAMDRLKEYPWKGNIRELRNIIERALLLIDEEKILKPHFLSFMSDLYAKGDKQSDKFTLTIPPNGIKIDDVIKDLILKTLKITNGNQVKAAKILGLSRSKLRYRMEQLNISVTKNFD
ncbi:MAG TPA: sigma-54-dependent Fis family transcriptional regulator [Ignavibacteria bacterium]|nr:sigma-54-dependent Fis family transcriptional regulator [Ignavibacteria bacterium]